jgi:SAM-dependent methyltransferase
MDDIFYEVFEALPRQGPGDKESTLKAFRLVKDLPDNPDILDIGCGSGRQTLDLACITTGKITAVDNHQPFLTQLQNKINKGQLKAEVIPVKGDMASLNFEEGSFDLIWSEGSCFIIGFKNALYKWRPLLKPLGSMVISDAVWFRNDQPDEVKNFWANEYSGIKYFEENFPVIEEAGFRITSYFNLPKDSWLTDYYIPLEMKLSDMRENYSDDKSASLFDSLQREIDIYRKYSDYYGYGFYIIQRTD